jgi:hypothetical protein
MSFDPSDVAWSFSSSASGSGSLARATQSRSCVVRARHRPSGIVVEMSHGPDHLTKGQWQAVKEELKRQALEVLAVKVVKSGVASR